MVRSAGARARRSPAARAGDRQPDRQRDRARGRDGRRARRGSEARRRVRIEVHRRRTGPAGAGGRAHAPARAGDERAAAAAWRSPTSIAPRSWRAPRRRAQRARGAACARAAGRRQQSPARGRARRTAQDAAGVRRRAGRGAMHTPPDGIAERRILQASTPAPARVQRIVRFRWPSARPAARTPDSPGAIGLPNPRRATGAAQVGARVTVGLHCGGEWGTVGCACMPEPGWQGSSHPATRVRNSVKRMRTLDLPRNLRTRARRQAPAHGAGEVPRRAGGRGRARGLAGDHAGIAALDLDLDARGLRGVHRADASTGSTRCRPRRASSSASSSTPRMTPSSTPPTA